MLSAKSAGPLPAYHTAAWTRELTSSLSRMLATWRLTVCGLSPNARAMCLLLSPAAMRERISTSRAVSRPAGAPGAGPVESM